MKSVLSVLLLLCLFVFRPVTVGEYASITFPLNKEAEYNFTGGHLEEKSSRGSVRKLTMEITAYSEHYESCGKHPGDYGYGITASGEKVRKGIVAADIDVIPMHSLIRIEGLGEFEVKDTGGHIKGHRLDLYLPSHKEAVKWGRQERKVEILRIGRD